MTNVQKLSESEEMYLATIARLQQDGQGGPVPLRLLAAELSVQPVSTNQMIRKLEKDGLVVYLPYKGVDLTPAGSDQANRILHHRCLWESFLVAHLGYSPDEAAPLACRLEHTLPPEAAERLAAFLDRPTPEQIQTPGFTATSTIDPEQLVPLSQLPIDQVGQVVQIKTNPDAGRFLAVQGIQPGKHLAILGRSGAEILAESENGQSIWLSEKLGEGILLHVDKSPCKAP
jgi:DtxR family Mn-dependent transcriptional regulator